MRLVPLKDWIDRTFDTERKPATQTIRSAIERGDWPSDAVQWVGRRIYIDLDRADAVNSDLVDFLTDVSA